MGSLLKHQYPLIKNYDFRGKSDFENSFERIFTIPPKSDEKVQ